MAVKVGNVSTQLDTELEVSSVPQIDEGDHERFTHIVLEGYAQEG